MVIALDKHKKPLGFMTERRARILMDKKRAVLYRKYPAAVIVKDRDVRELPDRPGYRIKIDPGSAHTGIAVVRIDTDEVMMYMQIHHRGQKVKKALDTRRMTRRSRRQRETRYRRCRFSKGGRFDCARKEGWLPPSVRSVGDNIINWTRKLKRYINITECSFEAVRFDQQLLADPDISGEEYQHGTLFGTEIREYLLERFGHTCQYCGGESGDAVLEWEHMVPRSRGGSSSVKNASLACRSCNRDKGNRTLPEYLEALKKNSRTSLNDARVKHITRILEGHTPFVGERYSAWANACRRYVERALFGIFGQVECSSGGRTKYNRTRLGLPKDHHYDALCVGTVPEGGYRDRTCGCVLHAEAMGRGSRFRGLTNSCGIIITKFKRGPKRRFGFMTGDIVRADVRSGKYAGIHTGRVMVRTTGWFDVRCTNGAKITAKYSDCRILQRSCGYKFWYDHAQCMLTTM